MTLFAARTLLADFASGCETLAQQLVQLVFDLVPVLRAVAKRWLSSKKRGQMREALPLCHSAINPQEWPLYGWTVVKCRKPAITSYESSMTA